MSNFSDFIGSSGGGGGSQVNDAKYINSSEDLIITDDGQHWQKSGITTTDSVLYPDATAAPGPIGTLTDPEVILPDNHDRSPTGQSVTNGKWLWYSNATGSMQIRATLLDGTGSSTEAYNGPDYQNMNGRLSLLVDRDGYLYSMHPFGYSSGFGQRYHEIRRYDINNSNGHLTYVGSVGGSQLDFGPYWGYILMPDEYNGRPFYFRVLAQSSSGVWRSLYVNKSSGNVGTQRDFYASDNGVKLPQDIMSINEFNGELWIKGHDGFMYVMDSGMTSTRAKIDVGTSSTFFSKTDSLGSTALETDTYDSMPSGSVSGVHNYQRMYEMTTNGYKNHPPGSVIGIVNQRIETAGVHLYTRIK
jgi:hypothetical protein